MELTRRALPGPSGLIVERAQDQPSGNDAVALAQAGSGQRLHKAILARMEVRVADYATCRVRSASPSGVTSVDPAPCVMPFRDDRADLA